MKRSRRQSQRRIAERVNGLIATALIVILTLRAHGQQFSCVAFSFDGQRLAAAAGDLGKPGEVVIWDAGPNLNGMVRKGDSKKKD